MGVTGWFKLHAELFYKVSFYGQMISLNVSRGMSTQYFSSLPSFSITQTRHLHIQVIAYLCFVDATGSGKTYEEAKANATKALLYKISKLTANDLRSLIYEEREPNDGLILEIEEIIQTPQKLLRKHILSANMTSGRVSQS